MSLVSLSDPTEELRSGDGTCSSPEISSALIESSWTARFWSSIGISPEDPEGLGTALGSEEEEEWKEGKLEKGKCP